jgi:hypothetical protein
LYRNKCVMKNDQQVLSDRFSPTMLETGTMVCMCNAVGRCLSNLGFGTPRNV